MKKKILSLCLIVAMVATAVVGASMAYLTDSDSDVNVMTLGNVDIEQKEDFEQGADLYPGTEVKKEVTVENVGDSGAYFRTLIAFEDIDSDTFGVNFPISEGYYTLATWGGGHEIEIDGVKYVVHEFVYNGTLEAGKTSEPSLTKVELSADSTNEDMEALGGTYEVLVLSQAVQTEGFANAQTALDTAFGDVTPELAKVWFQGMTPTVVSNDDELNTAIEEGAEILFLMDGTYIIPDSAQGKTLTIIGSEGVVIATQNDGSYEGCDYSLDGSTVTFNNITINTDSRTYTGYARLNATYNNCTINGTYTLYGNSEFNNCTFTVSGDVYNIWTWGAPNATFNNCTFNSDGKAILLYGTVNTNLTLNDCVFNDNGGLTDLKAAIEIGNDYGKSYTLIVNNTVVNGYEINDKGINTGTTLWANKNSMGTDKLNVIVDGVDVY